MNHPATSRKAPAFLTGGGEMGERIRSFDWNDSLVGPVHDWPQSLKTAVQIMLASRYPMFVWWGDRLVNLYNDAYAPMLGARHPGSLGEPAAEIWQDVWDIVGPQTEAVLKRGESTWNKDTLLIMERYGYSEEAYFTFSYSPILDDSGRIGGLFCAVMEETDRVLGERRSRTLRDLGEMADSLNAEEACRIAAIALSRNPHDIPFALVYLIDPDRRRASLRGMAAPQSDQSGFPPTLDLTESKFFGLARIIESGQRDVIENLTLLGSLPVTPWGVAPSSAVISPLLDPALQRVEGFLISGVNPKRQVDEAYSGFFDLIAGQVSTAVANARAHDAERKRAEALAEIDRAKTEFFSNVSHEFRTPLTLMLGPVEDMLSMPEQHVQPESRRALEVVHRNGLRLQKLVNTLLDFSRIEAGRMKAVYEPLDLCTLTEELTAVFRSTVEKAGMTLIVDCPSLSGPVYVDRDLWEKITFNLLSNAFKFTFEGEIAVRIREVNGNAEMEVRDTGIGIAESELPHLFERFHRVRGASGRSHEGSGIGLALVRDLVKLHGGEIAVESLHGAGTSFIVRIPMGTAHLQPHQISGQRDSAPSGVHAQSYVDEAAGWLSASQSQGNRAKAGGDSAPGAAQILLADDNADVRDYIRNLLASRYSVVAVGDGEAALKAVGECTFDLVLTDIMMPRLDGFGLLRRLRGDPRTAAIPVIMLSARSGEESRVEGFDAGADDYLVKPFTARELLARVGSHIMLARSRKAMEDRLVSLTEQLSDERDRLRAVLGSAKCLLWNADIEDVGDGLKWTNVRLSTDEEVAREMLNVDRSSDETYLQAWRRARLPEDSERTKRDSAKAIRANKSFRQEFRVSLKSGEVRWLVEDVHITAKAPGKWYAVGVCTDITDQKLIESRLRSVANSVPSIIWSASPDGTITYASEQWYEYTGISPERNARDWPVVLHPDDHDRCIAAWSSALRDGLDYEIEVRNRRRDGAYRWFVTRAIPAKDPVGRIITWFGSTTDIHDLKLAQGALKESEERMRLSMEAGRAFSFEVDAATGVTSLSGNMKEVLGFAPEEGIDVMGAVTTFIRPEDRERVGSALQSALRGESEFRLEYEIADPGTKRSVWLESAATLFPASGEKSARLVGISINITERKRAEEALRERQEEVEQLNTRLQRAMTETHHRVKNNLQVIAGLVDLQLLEGESSIPADEVRRIGSHTRTLAAVHDLLTNEAKEKGDAHSISARAVLSKLITLLGAGTPERPLATDFDDTLLNARQSTSLSLVASELINNALKHGAGKVFINFRVHEKRARLEVRDEGSGFPAHFDVRKTANTGLELVENLGRWDLAGEVTYSNHIDGGGLVTLAFPLIASVISSRTDSEKPPATSETGVRSLQTKSARAHP